MLKPDLKSAKKRKSGSDEELKFDVENEPPNKCPYPEFRSNLIPSSIVKMKNENRKGINNDEVTSAKPMRSGLPRFNSMRNCKNLNKSTKDETSNEKVPESPSTPVKAALECMDSPGTTAIMNKLKHYLIQPPSISKIRVQFENSITVNEDSIASILSNLKVKTKWDYKEKSKKQEVAIKELRECLSLTLTQIDALRNSTLGSVSEMDELIRQAQSEMQDMVMLIASLKSKEVTSRNEISRLQEEISMISSSYAQVKGDLSPLRRRENELIDGEGKHEDLNERLQNEEKNRLKLESTIVALETELKMVKESSAEALLRMKDQYEQRMEVGFAGYKDEVASLRQEIQRRQSDIERTINEKSAADTKSTALKEDLLLTQASLREAEAILKRSQVDVDKLNNELIKATEQLKEKEADLRATFNTLQEIQKQSFTEKNSARDEISSLQARTRTLEEERISNIAELAARREEVVSLSKELVSLRESLSMAEKRFESCDKEARLYKETMMQFEVERELRSRSEIREEAERTERIAACAQLLATQSECDQRIRDAEQSYRMTLEAIQAKLNFANDDRDRLNRELHDQSENQTRLESEMASLRHALNQASFSQEKQTVEELGRVTGEVEILKRRIIEADKLKDNESSILNQRIRELEEELKSGEQQRRKLHNVIQELRGNVRVFARVRPFLPSDVGGNMIGLPDPTVQARGDGTSVVVNKALGGDAKPEDHLFVFDRVFGPSASQESIFTEVSEFVQSALDGYNVCLFSYGQTGSGKTHTMQGSGNGSMRGIIPRAMQQVGIYKRELESKGWSYSMEVSFIEIYNETIRDLLRPNGAPSQASAKHEIKKDPSGSNSMIVTDIISEEVDPNDDVNIEAIMERAARHRSTAQTAMNEQSSRSHSVFTLRLKACNEQQNTLLQGTLSLVDLAGSERLDRSGATGNRMKETVAINKSLSALTDVFVAIGNKQTHIPFRNSKLTYLLQPALSGDGKTLMMVNLSPTEESFFESLCSLRFARQVNQCELGKPKKQIRGTLTANPLASASCSSLSQPTESSQQRGSSILSTTSTSSGPKKIMRLNR